MSTSVPRLAWYRFRRTFHRRWGGYLAVTLLVGLVGGVALAAVAGARRTQSAFPTYLATSDASDLQVGVYLQGGKSAVANLYSPALTRELARLPDVRRVSASLEVFILPIGPGGRPTFPPALDNEVSTVGTVGGAYVTVDRPVVARGRLPDPARVGQFMATTSSARLLHLHVGETVPMGAFTFAQLDANDFSTPVFRFAATLVGTVTLSSGVVNDEVDRYPTPVIFTPALTDRLLAVKAAGFPEYALVLDHGARDVATVEREIITVLPPGTLYSFHQTPVVAGQVERAIKPEAIALGAFGVIALLATLLIATQAISRSLGVEARDLEILRALGAGPASAIGDALLGVLVAVLVGALLAAGLCVALSPIAPIGAVRVVDPSPGFAVDWTVVAGGAALFVVGLGLIATALALVTVRRERRGRLGSAMARSSPVVTAAMRAGLPPSSVAGLRFAVDRGRGRDAVPVGSAMAGAVLAVAVVVTTLTFGSGLHTLVSHPELYGWNWNDAITEVGGGNVPAVTTRLLDHDPDVAAWAGYNYGDGQIDGQTVPFLISDDDAAVTPPILSGHALTGGRQIVLGGTTLAQLHKHVGQYVTASYGSPRDAPAYIPPVRLKIVGTATLPAIGNPGVLHVSMGLGAMVPKEITPAAFAQVQSDPDPNLNGWAIVVVRTRPQLSAAAGLASVRRVAAQTTRTLASDPDANGTFQALSVQQPAEIVNYRTMGSTPALLASGLALGAVAALGLTLVASVRRRRRDLALLKTIGFVPRQLAAVVAWQASAAAVVGVVLGVPVGIIAGKALWTVFAHEIVAVPRPTVPVLQIVLVVGGALVLANLVALVPGRLAARTPTGALLRTE